MSEQVPILPVGDILIVTVQDDLHDRTALRLREDLSAQIARRASRGVLLDISALDMVDSFVARQLALTAAAARVMGARTVVVGMRPAVAMTLVELGADWEGLLTAPNVERGLDTLGARAGAAGREG